MSENYERNKKANGAGGACNLLINGVLAYFFYQYAYKNPDQGQCWATDENHVASPVELPGYTNVSQQFETWFWWGFLINILCIVVACLQILAGSGNNLFDSLSKCIGAPLGCGWLAWFIAGMVLRWREVGNICSGEYATTSGVPYQWKSGKFIDTFLVITLCLWALACCCGCCVAVFASVSANRS